MAIVLKKANEIVTSPLDVGDGKLSLVDVIAQPENAPVSAGVCEIWALPPRSSSTTTTIARSATCSRAG